MHAAILALALATPGQGVEGYSYNRSESYQSYSVPDYEDVRFGRGGFRPRPTPFFAPPRYSFEFSTRRGLLGRRGFTYRYNYDGGLPWWYYYR